MIYQTSHDTAGNGMTVNSTVELLMNERRPFDAKPWRAQTQVNCATMCHSHHATLNQAKRETNKMHACYLKVHSSRKAVQR